MSGTRNAQRRKAVLWLTIHPAVVRVNVPEKFGKTAHLSSQGTAEHRFVHIIDDKYIYTYV